jgi:hypothetical protein
MILTPKAFNDFVQLLEAEYDELRATYDDMTVERQRAAAGDEIAVRLNAIEAALDSLSKLSAARVLED